MEKYQVITRGRVVEGRSVEHVGLNLQKQFGLEPSVANRLLSGKVVTIKKKLDWASARSWQQKLTKVGLRTELKIQFTPECFKAGITETTKHSKSTKHDQTILIPESHRIAPPLVSLPHTQEIKTQRGQSAVKLDTYSAYWNPLVLLLACTFVGLILQRYLLHFLSVHLQQNLLVTISGIAFLLLTIICLPRWLQPRQLYSLSDSQHQERIAVLEQCNTKIGRIQHRIYNDNGTHIASLQHSAESAELCDAGGMQLFQWHRHIRVTHSGQELANQIRDQLLENTALGTVATYSEYLGKLFGFMRRKRAGKATHNGDQQWLLDSARPVLNAGGNLVALVYLEPEPAIKLLDSERTTTEQLMLLAFCCQLIRNPLA
ncbi:hypothetical protein ACNKU7_02045 [Microbulbifer sp. SA54]|uniref:hypothetical protein n=1 Tax=Microbulbifer sp. SA54 TaxID=3401577 RepID=UPI003AB08DC0